MTEIFLFDWGDTLMIDFPGVPGKMCDWEKLETVEGAEDALKCISKRAQIYIATGAAESTELDVKKAFHRVHLDRYITGYFCKANLGIDKGSRKFLLKILSVLGKSPNQVTMVGDSYAKDIEPALELGMNAIWLTKGKNDSSNNYVKTIGSLQELCFYLRKNLPSWGKY